MKLVERHIIKRSDSRFKECDHLTFLSKNLYNATLYAVRQEFFDTKKYLSYNKVNKDFIANNQDDYRALPSKVAQQTQRLVDNNFKSFFALLRKKQSGEYSEKVEIPKYLHKSKGRQIVHYVKGALSFVKKQGFIHLSKTDIYIKTELTKEKVQFVRIIPRGNHFILEVGYQKSEKGTKVNNGRYLSIDLGVNNLATCVSSHARPFIINGKPVKSINQFYNKMIAKEKSKVLYTNRHITNLYNNRGNKIDNYLHKASKLIVNFAVSNNINTIVIGYNKGWKQNTNIGKKNNQNFQFVPFDRFINMIKYKAELEGITVVSNEESYTSKCSFLDNEDIQKQEKYKGKRIKRGLFQSSNKQIINADVNAALNILKKYLIKNVAWNDQVWSDLVGVCSTPFVSKVYLD